MKKIALFIALVFIFAPLTAKAEISAQSAVVIDCASNRILYEKNAEERRGMASTTKIMTALIALERLTFDEVVTVSSFAAGTEGSSIWLSAGEHMTAQDLLYGLMLASGNDAATALAEHTAGSVEAFTLLMNEKAKEIGAYNTNFTNPHGLSDENHYTTAYDLALIASYAMKNDTFREIVSTQNKTISWEGSQWNRSLKNHNKLLYMYDDCDGVKTGYTKKDGRCLVSSAERDGMRIVTVTLSDPDDWNDHINLMNYAFETHKPYTVCRKGESAGSYLTENADIEEIGLSYAQTYTTALSDGEEDTISTKVEFSVTYPVNRGDRVGTMYIYRGSELIGSVGIISREKAEEKPTYFEIILNLLKGTMKT
ncbi:MAG: D-alanyl-D-alanine carboxypeptidase [Clostridia bacterium]|nr:D-alanyl-D-alanine carboxypeptidase [Clostridia bacterium]